MGGMGMAQSGAAPKRTVKGIMVPRKVLPGTQVRFRNTKSGPKIRSIKSPK